MVGPDFRILGSNRIGPSGSSPTSPADMRARPRSRQGNLRYVCQISLFVARDGGISKVETEGLDLAEVATSAVRIELDPNGNAYFSVPGRREAPTLIRFAGGQATTVLTANQQIPELGVALGNVEAVDISPQATS